MPTASKTKANLSAFSEKAQMAAQSWSSQTFADAFLGPDNLRRLNAGETLNFPAFEMWMDGSEMLMRHRARDGKPGAQVRVNSRNAERLYFATCVDNHLLHAWPYVIYEQPDGEGGRVDVALWSGPQHKGGKVLALYENKQASIDGAEFKIEEQRASAIRQSLSRIERLCNDGEGKSQLGKKVAISVCLFDKKRVNLSSAGEYYNNHAKTLGADEDRLAMAESAMESSGMWIESWIVDVETLMAKRPDQREAWLIGKQESSTSSPMLPLAAEKGSRVAVAGLDEKMSRNRVVYTTLDKMMNYPFLNPAGFSDAQNTRDLILSKARVLAASIADSVLRNLSAWKRAGGSPTAGILDESFFTLGANDRELHLVQSSCFEAEGAAGHYEQVWVCGDVGFANGQHSTLAFQMIREALAGSDMSTAQAFSKSFLSHHAFSGDGYEKEAVSNLTKTLASVLDLEATAPGELKYFFDHVILQTSIKWARDDKHSWRLSYESNNAVEQDPEDMLIHGNRQDIKHALAALSKECSRQQRPNPLVMAKNHQSTLAERLQRDDLSVQLPAAIQWMAADSMFRSKHWGGEEQRWRNPEKKGNAKGAYVKNKQETAALIEEVAKRNHFTIPASAKDQAAADLLGYQAIYRSIFSSTKAERKAIYGDMRKTLMAGDDLTSSILEDLAVLKDDFAHKSEGAAARELVEFCEILANRVDSGVSEGWIGTSTATVIKTTLQRDIERLEGGRIKRGDMLRKIEELAQEAVDEIYEQSSTPAALHAASICAQALNEFKKETCKATLASRRSINDKETRSFDKFSEVLSLGEHSFWSKEASFDMLVAASLAKAHGSVLAHGEYKIEPDKADGSAWPEKLAARVKAAAAIALEKIELLSIHANLENKSLVSHYFRHIDGAQRLLRDDPGGKLMQTSVNEAGLPTHLGSFNFYEWIMNSGVPSSPGRLATLNAQPVAWLDEDVVAPSKSLPQAPSVKTPRA